MSLCVGQKRKDTAANPPTPQQFAKDIPSRPPSRLRAFAVNSGRTAFTLVELLVTVAVLIIVLGLMVSMARNVRSRSATLLTTDMLRRLDEAMTVYVHGNNEMPPALPLFIADLKTQPPEASLQRAAEINNEAFVRLLKGEGAPRSGSEGGSNLLAGRFDDLSIAYYDEVRVRDAWGSPIVFMPTYHPDIGMTPRGWFFFSAGPDRKYLDRDDNLYSYDLSPTMVK